MQICRKVAGFSYGKADSVRKAMSKKKPELLEQMRAEFLKGAKENFIDVKIADELFDDMASFAKYAFNKAHAAAYAVTSYRTAYMKTHYPCEYAAALLTSVMGSHGKTAEYIEDCRHMGVSLLPPDINQSDLRYSVAPEGIRYGLGGIKGIGEGFVNHIKQERSRRPFRDFMDFAERMTPIELNRQQAQALISVGAFDGMGNTRAELLAGVDKVMQMLADARRRNLDGQMDLFGDSLGGEASTDSYHFDPIPEYSAGQRLRMEKEYTGLCLSGSLLDDYSLHLEALNPDELLDVANSFDEEGEPVENAMYKEGDTLLITGILSKITRKTTKNGASMAFVQIEDRKGEAELIIFPKQFETAAGLLRTDNAVWVKCSVSVKDDQGPKLLANELGALLTDVEWKQAPMPPALPQKPISKRREATGSAEPAPRPASSVSIVGAVQAAPAPAVTPAAVAPTTARKADNSISAAQPKSAPATVYLRVERMDAPIARKAMLLCEIFNEGNVQAVFYDVCTGKYIRTSLSITASPYVVRELIALLGEGNVVLR